MKDCCFVMIASKVTNEIFNASTALSPFHPRKSIDQSKIILKYKNSRRVPYEAIAAIVVGPLTTKQMRRYLSKNKVAWESSLQ